MSLAELAPPASASTKEPGRSFAWTFERWTILLLALGIGWRVLRYVLQFPVWGDEAMLCANFLDRGYLDVFDGMWHAQVAPILFVWTEMTIVHWWGGSELVVRLVPIVAGLAALPVFWRFTRQIADRPTAMLALALLSVSYFPVRHAVEVKPYSLDLLLAALLLLLASRWMACPKHLSGLVMLGAILPVALGYSNPLVFVAGGVMLALLPTVWRASGTARLVYMTAGVGLIGSFLVYLQMNVWMQTGAPPGAMQRYWASAFPPADPVALLKWLVNIHTSGLMAYPLGGKNGASTFTFLLVLLGIWRFAREKRWQLLVLLLSPFALTLIAAALRRYPYGESARVAQHLVPAIIVLAASGLMHAIALGVSMQRRSLAIHLAFVGLVTVGCVGIVRDAVQPFKTTSDQECREVIRAIDEFVGPDRPIVYLGNWRNDGSEFTWNLRQRHPDIVRTAPIDWNSLHSRRSVVCVRPSLNPAPGALPEAPSGWRLVGQTRFMRSLPAYPDRTEFIDAFELEYRP